MRHVIAILLLASTTANGAEDEKPWSGSAALGILATSGNSDTTSSNASLAMTYDLTDWHHEAQLLASGADTDGVSTAERYKASYKAKRDFTEHDYVFGLLGYEKDKFSGYDQQTTQAIGYGRRILDQDNQVLNLEAGAGFKQSDLRDGTTEDGAIFRVGGDYLWKFSQTGQFTQVIGIEQGSDNTFLESVSAIKARLMEQMSLVLSFTLKSNSDVPAGSEKTDTFTAISLEYGF